MSDRIREILSELLLMEVTDPALQGVTVTSVSLDREMEYADVRVNALGDESREKEVMRGLERANGFLRREIGGPYSYPADACPALSLGCRASAFRGHRSRVPAHRPDSACRSGRLARRVPPLRRRLHSQ